MSSGPSAGFADPVHDAQACFRAVLEAMAHPGRVLPVGGALRPPAPLGAAAAAVLLTLTDADTAVWTDAGDAVAEWLRFHAGCALVADPSLAAFALATGAPPALDRLAPGTDEAPQRSATLLLGCEGLREGAGWALTGPGIEHAQRLLVAGVPADFVPQWTRNRALFPRGVDLILCAPDRIAALPRAVAIEAA